MKIAYVFTRGRRERLAQIEAGESAPSEFAFGAPEARAMGHEVAVFELPDLAPTAASPMQRWMKRDAKRLAATGLTSSAALMGEEAVLRLNDFDVVLAGNEYIALGLDGWAEAGVLRTPFCFWVMGMFSKLAQREPGGPLQRWRRTRGLARYHAMSRRARHIFFLGRPEMALFVETFPELEPRCAFTPFPVDTGFWHLAETKETDGYLLFVGKDALRDVDLLLAIARAMPEQRFRCVTPLLAGRLLPPNVEVIDSDWYGQAVTDREMRELYRRCRLLILPLRETHQPSGQSVAQQAMACGRVVVMSRISGLWLDELADGDQLRLIDCPTPEAWRGVITRQLNDAEATAAIERRAAAFVRQHLRTDLFARMLLEHLSQPLL